jgi:hypothetical protein
MEMYRRIRASERALFSILDYERVMLSSREFDTESLLQHLAESPMIVGKKGLKLRSLDITSG